MWCLPMGVQVSTVRSSSRATGTGSAPHPRYCISRSRRDIDRNRSPIIVGSTVLYGGAPGFFGHFILFFGCLLHFLSTKTVRQAVSSRERFRVVGKTYEYA